MKKLHLLFGLIMSLLLVGVVKAEGPYNLDFETTVTSRETAYQHEEYQNGYLLSTYTSNNDILYYYSAKGDVLKTKKYTEYIEGIKADGKDIYLLLKDTNEYYVAKLNENLEEIARKKITVGEPGEPSTNYDHLEFLEVANMDSMYIDGDLIVVFARNIGFVTAKKDLTEATARAVTEQDVIKYYPAYSVIKNIFPRLDANDEYFKVFDYSDGNLIADIAKPKPNCEIGGDGNEEFPNIGFNDGRICTIHELRLYDQSGNVKWSKEVSNNETISELKFSNGYILAIYNTYSTNSEMQFNNANKIVVYDLKGNTKQTLNSSIGFYSIKPSTAGFMVEQSTCKHYGFPIEAPIGLPQTNTNIDHNLREWNSGDGALSSEAGAECRSNHQIYSIVLNIETKVTKGKGTVEAIKSSRPGAPVTFVVTPAEGYVLGEVRVTDANGKTIVFKQNTFTMPTADVLIEAEFLPANPETKDIAIMAITILTITAGAVFLLNRKKIKEIS